MTDEINDDQLDEFNTNLQTFGQSLPPEQQQLLGAIVETARRSVGAEPDIEAEFAAAFTPSTAARVVELSQTDPTSGVSVHVTVRIPGTETTALPRTDRIHPFIRIHPFRIHPFGK